MRHTRLGLVAALLTAAAVSPAATAVSPAAAAVPATASRVASTAGPVVAPYAEVSDSPRLLDAAIATGRLRAFTAAFVLGHRCTPIWDAGSTTPVARSRHINDVVRTAQRGGARLILSFGGAAPPELAVSCHRTDALAAAYRSVLRRFHTHDVDFDVEGAALDDAASIARRFDAIRALEHADPKLRVSFTLPVDPDRFEPDAVRLLRAARAHHAHINLVNVMTMDYGPDVTDMSAATISSARAAVAKLRHVFGHWSYARLGITPMIGRNDVRAETFSLADAASIRAFAVRHGVGRLAFWAVQRDRACTHASDSNDSCSHVDQSRLAFVDAFAGR